MIKCFKRISYLLLFFQLPFMCFSQQYTLKEIANAYKLRLENNPKEYSFIHTDRDLYSTGDELWFKIYLLNQSLSDSASLSKVCYLMLCDENGLIIEKQTLKVKGKSAAGLLSLPKNLTKGTYFLVATTMWMQNEKFNYFIKKFYIKEQVSEEKKVVMKPALSVGFFPEGGSLLAGVEQKIAVRSINQNGQSVEATILIKNNKKETITTLKTDKFGMGSFLLNPSNNDSFTAECFSNENTSKLIISLPLVENNGITLSVNNQNEKKMFVGLKLTPNELLSKEDYYLIAHINGELVFAEVFKPSEDLNFIPINKSNFPKGVLQLILINNKGLAVAERLAWIDKKDSTNTIQITLEGTGSKRSNSEITINTNTKSKADLSLSIARLDMCDTTQLDINKFSLLMPLLGAQLDHHPFQLQKIIGNSIDADNLMLTNGWRKVNNVDIMKDAFLKYSFENGLFFAGTLTKAQVKTPIQKGKVDLILQNSDSTKYLYSESTNEKGQFIFRDLPIKKNAQAYFGGTNINNKDALLDINLFPHFTDTLKRFNFLNFTNLSIPSELASFYKKFEETSELKKYKELEGIKVRSKRTNIIDSVNKEYVSALFENAEQTLIFKDEPGLTIWQLLQRNISALSIEKTDSGTVVMFNRYAGAEAFSENGSSGGVQFFLNELPVTTIELETLLPADIAVIKVYKGGLGYVLGASNGAIALYTVKGRNTNDWRDKSFTKIKLNGYEPDYKFYYMDYSKINAAKVTTDYRPLLYWNPSLKINEQGKAKITFAIDDYSGPWLLQLQGIDENNEPVYFRKQLY